MTWRELKQRLDAIPAHVLDQPVCYVEPYDNREIVEPDFISVADEDIVDCNGRHAIRKGEPFLA